MAEEKPKPAKAAKAPKPAPGGLRDRIKEFKRMDADDLMDNQGNWRTHPAFQRDALRGILNSVGIADALIAYHSERQGGLTLVDGHMRKEDFPDVEWPVLILDISDEEADLLMLSLDPLAAMAEASSEKLAELLATVNSEQGALQDLLLQQQAQAELAKIMEQAEQALSGLTALGDGGGDLLKKRHPEKLITLIIWVKDVADVERAILAVGNPHRGEAIVEICQAYLGK